jgi:hypothetical protein
MRLVPLPYIVAAICVRYIVACYDPDVGPSYKRDMRKKFAWLISAALFTFILQVQDVTSALNVQTIPNSVLMMSLPQVTPGFS